MLKEVKKGNKVPYNGVLLNKREYNQYQHNIKVISEIFDEVQTWNNQG